MPLCDTEFPRDRLDCARPITGQDDRIERGRDQASGRNRWRIGIAPTRMREKNRGSSGVCHFVCQRLIRHSAEPRTAEPRFLTFDIGADATARYVDLNQVTISILQIRERPLALKRF